MAVFAALRSHLLGDPSPSDMKPSKACMLGSRRRERWQMQLPCHRSFMLVSPTIKWSERIHHRQCFQLHMQDLDGFAAKENNWRADEVVCE